MPELILSHPNEKQKQFFLDRHKYTAFGGARGGGKSWAVRTKAILLALKYPGIKIIVIRRTYPELTANHIDVMRSQLFGIAKYNGTGKLFTFPGGSTIKFSYCANDGDLDNFQGIEADVVFLDEATQFSEHQYKIMTAIIRGVNGFPKRMYLTCNPGGVGHSWVKRLFIDRRFSPEERAEDYSFIKSLVTDNTALLRSQPDYVRQLEALPEKLRRAWLLGDWDIFEGQFFEEFTDDPAHYEDRKYTHVIDEFAPPESWKIFRSYDFGYNKPFSCAWWAVDYDGVIYRILELYGCTKNPDEGVKWTPEKQFREIKKIESEHPWLKGKDITGVADPAIWDASRGDSIADTAMKYGIYFAPGDNARIPGWMQLHYRMAFDENGFPMMYIFKNCRAYIRTLPTLEYSATNPEDLDTSQEDHAADEARYFCMSRPIKPRMRPDAEKVADDPLDMIPMEKKIIVRQL